MGERRGEGTRKCVAAFEAEKEGLARGVPGRVDQDLEMSKWDSSAGVESGEAYWSIGRGVAVRNGFVALPAAPPSPA